MVEDDAHPFRPRHLSAAAWSVLCALRSAGHETYVCGGTVRDILLGQSFKDVDILTSAESAPGGFSSAVHVAFGM